MKETKTPEINEVKKPEPENYKNIKPEKGMTAEKAKGFWNKVFDKIADTAEGLEDKINNKEFGPKYNTMKYLIDHTPTDDSDKGHWEGKRGESKFIPNDNTEAGMEAKEKLAEYGMDGIKYKNGEPDFSKCSEISVTIDEMTEYRPGNFDQADEACAKRWNDMGKDGKTDWKKSDVIKWREENKYTWHERCDTKTMDLVSRKIHNTDAQIFTHSGGCSECRTRDMQKTNKGEMFDE